MIVVERDDLAAAVDRVKLMDPTGAVKPTLLVADQGRLDLATDNLDARVDTYCPADGELAPHLMPWVLLESVVHHLQAGPVRLEPTTEFSGLRITTGSDSAVVPGMDPEAFPQRQRDLIRPREMDFTEAWSVMKRILMAREAGATGWTADVTLAGGWIFATDKIRVHRLRVATPEEEAVRLPGKVLQHVLGAGADVTTLRWDAKRFELVGPDLTWHAGMPDVAEAAKVAKGLTHPFSTPTDSSITFDRKEMVAAIKAVMGMKLITPNVGWTVENAEELGVVRLDRASGKRRRLVAAKVEGPVEEVWFQGEYILGTLQALEADQVTMVGQFTVPAGRRMGAWRMADTHLEACLMPTTGRG